MSESQTCISGQILQGLKKPHDCPAFGKECTPERPLGATMVSSEGACAAYYHYGRYRAMPAAASRCSPRERNHFIRSREPLMPDAFDLDRLTCPLPLADYAQVLLGHGSGGKLTAELIQQVFLPAWENSTLAALEDQATLDLSRQWRPSNGTKAPRIAFTTDSFVVRPLFFPGGDIGKLAVHGTVNDLAVGGAIPLVSFGRLHLGRRTADGRSAQDRGLDARAPATRRA